MYHVVMLAPHVLSRGCSVSIRLYADMTVTMGEGFQQMTIHHTFALSARLQSGSAAHWADLPFFTSSLLQRRGGCRRYIIILPDATAIP